MRIHTLLVAILWYASLSAQAQSKDTTERYSGGRSIIADISKILGPAGIQEDFQAEIGGLRQWVYVRGQDTANPIILFVHGGPASPLAPVMWTFQRPVEEYFTMVNYDQRAAGKTFLANDTVGLGNTIHISSYIDDAIALTEILLKKYHKRKVILMGHSWGTVVAMGAALKRPDLYYAYIGVGQAINVMDNEAVSFEFGLAEARRRNDTTAIRELESIAPYPGNKPVTRERIIIARKWPQTYGGLGAYRDVPLYFFRAPYLSPEYSRAEVRGIDEGNIFTLSRILPEFLKVDYKQVTNFPIPVLMFMGRHDYTTPSAPTAAWLEKVKAPYKKGIWFENSSHLLPMEEPGKFLLSLVEYVRPLAK
ncbi:alpha/beta fold hydrolase [Chitinophaga sp. Hz27]|uniref:alpha/beta fold hydrolase n=1 Tax=Chitinophaga sp. Hz27 TaxID=3347169 RepID=UPI0035DA38B9